MPRPNLSSKQSLIDYINNELLPVRPLLPIACMMHTHMT